MPAARGLNMSVIRTSGTDFFGQFAVGPHSAPGQLLIQMPFTPVQLHGTRLGLEAALWQRWRPVRLALRYLGAGPATSGGSLVFAWSPDVTHTASHTASTVSFAMAQERSRMARLDESFTLAIPCEAAYRWYQTEDLGRESSHGSLVASLMSPPTGITGQLTLCFALEWVVEWQGRKLDMTEISSVPIYPDAGYVNIFTTSTSSFDSTVLTFKASSGGYMVSFTSARPGSIYTVSPGVTVPYVDEQGKSQTCSWFSLVIGFSIKGLVLHATQGDALSYQRTGDKKYCLKYHAAGAVVTPSRPAFMEVAVQHVHEPVAGPSHQQDPPPPPQGSDSLEDRLARLEEMMRNFLRIHSPRPPDELAQFELSSQTSSTPE